MPPLQPGSVLRHIRQVLEAPSESHRLDRELLHEFASRRDEAAFAALLRRHGRLVLGVCRRVLGNSHDAEDIFQATFLILARKASSIRKGDSVGSWLHGVAYRLAMKERASSGRRRQEERHAAGAAPADPAAEQSWRELQELLDEELGGLPEKFRAPLILCYLEGKTQDEAARCLSWSLGTFRRRLDQGRELLRSRLTRHGLTLSAVLFPALLAQTATAAAPLPLLVSTLQAATAFARGEAAALGFVSAKVAFLAEEVLKGMLLTKMKYAAAALVLVASLSGSGIAVRHYYAAAEPAGKSAPPASAKPAPPETKPAAAIADREMIESLLKLPNQVPPLFSDGKEKPLRFEDLPTYSRKALLPYAADNKANRLRTSVEKAVRALIDTNKAFADTLPTPWPENQQQKNALARQLSDRQLNLAEVYSQLDAALAELKLDADLRDKETPRWKANYDYLHARLLFRMVHFYEYQVALGNVRANKMPPLDKKIHKTYRLTPRAELSDKNNKDEKTLVQEAKIALERLAEENKGTPWEIIAKRALETKLGLEWKPN